MQQQSSQQRPQAEQQRVSGQTQNSNSQDSLLTGSTWLTKDASGFFAFGQVMVGLGQALLFFVQLRFMRKGMEDATNAANAAREGATAARDSADVSKLALIAGERAYVHYSGCRFISHRSRVDGSVFWRLRPVWINAGKTPARRVKVYWRYELLDGALPDDYPFVVPEDTSAPEAMIAAGGRIESAGSDIDGQTLSSVSEGRKHLYVWGVATYRDVFPDTPLRVTKFCVFAHNLTGDPTIEWNESTNPFDMPLGTLNRNNCMDDDCGMPQNS
ncbi:hypothetical protein [uncultured Bradyrhizobium sp.]|uniref:hypothetical protein n=1 Tax=uncultured Bradyrhizobium sp. TaxID=199684 RepID=UPI00263453F3|nr:hypothetical protein [uncultured Bradyrhizobium sp.]